MSETLEPTATEGDQKQRAEQLLAQAKEQGVELVGPYRLLNQLTKYMLEIALDAQMIEHLGYDKHDPVGLGGGNSRNGTRAKTVHRDRPSGDRGHPGHELFVCSADSQGTPAPGSVKVEWTFASNWVGPAVV